MADNTTAPVADEAANAHLIAEAQHWVSIDPDERTRAELTELIESAEAGQAEALTELAERFSGFLQFGTAGLRAELGAGPMRMNRVVVRRAAAGLADYAVARAEKEGWRAPTAVVGYDARYNSDIFAEETAAIFEAAGIHTRLMPQALPTPVLAWATREYNAEIGVIVTASHNPPNDNGYKVYLGGQAVEESAAGAQIVPPFDTDIAAAISNVKDEEIRLAESGWEILDAGIADRYIERIGQLTERADRDLRIVYTAMHGVGGATITSVLANAGFTDVTPVAEQFEPDPAFPTVSFPNPEEPHALDLAFALAEKTEADLIIANDPDADRAAFAVYDPAVSSWRQLRGDEIGVLLGRAMIERLGEIPSGANAPIFANSVVSSRQLGAIAAAAGIEHRETLTGFKWIARIENLAYGYEEAIGYSVAPEAVKDKDGISAGLMVALYAQQLKSAGSSLTQVLDEIAYETGVYATDQVSIRVEDLSQITTMMATLRGQAPATLGGSAVIEDYDLSQGTPTLPPTNGMLYLTEDNTRVIVRPSGTEPKLKCYLEVVRAVPEATPQALTQARAEAQQQLQQVAADVRTALGL